MHVCIPARMLMYAYTDMKTHIRTSPITCRYEHFIYSVKKYMCVQTHRCVQVCAYINVYTYVDIYVYLYVYTYLYIRVCILFCDIHIHGIVFVLTTLLKYKH